MKVLVIGATGTLGGAVADALEASGQDVVAASRSSSPSVDLEDPTTFDGLFAAVPDAAAVICCAAGGPLLDLATVTDEEFDAGIRAKLLGQVALARRAIHHLPDGGSITLTGGTFVSPLPRGSLGALVNSGLDGFVRNAAAELPRRLRLNVVSPGWIQETPGSDGGGTPAAEVARHYVDSVNGVFTGRTITVA